MQILVNHNPKRLALALATAALAGCTTLARHDERRVTFDCDIGPGLTVVFGENAARIVNADGTEIVLPQRETGSGYLYETPTHSLRGQGIEAIYTVGRMAPMRCRQNNTANM